MSITKVQRTDDSICHRDFRLIDDGSYSVAVPLCEPTFRVVHLIPPMAHYFFVSGFSFLGDAVRALKACADLGMVLLGGSGTGAEMVKR